MSDSTVIDCVEQPTKSSKKEHSGTREYTRSFVVLVSRDSVTNEAGSPLLVEEYLSSVLNLQVYPVASYYLLPNGDSDSLSWLSSVETVQQSDFVTYHVTCEYASYESMAKSGTNNVLNQPWQITWSQKLEEKPAVYDLNGLLIVNSAGQPFDPPVIVYNCQPELNVVRNEATFAENYAQLYMNSINSDTFLGYGPGNVFCQNIGSTREFDMNTGQTYWAVNYQFLFTNDPNGFNKFVLDCGYKQLNSSGYLVDILTGSGATISSPGLLDGTGHALPDGSGPAAAVYLQFTTYNSLPFSVFNLDPLQS